MKRLKVIKGIRGHSDAEPEDFMIYAAPLGKVKAHTGAHTALPTSHVMILIFSQADLCVSFNT